MALQQDWEQSDLGTYLQYDFWSVEDGLCILAGFDRSTDSVSTPYQHNWTSTLWPADFQGHASKVDESEATTLLERMQNDLKRLQMIWMLVTSHEVV